MLESRHLQCAFRRAPQPIDEIHEERPCDEDAIGLALTPLAVCR